ncbi:hypothetical protein [Burkholderia sp. Ac-20365]|uniref:hypothetical protein n=1 Tax=Burkholderia sp. Ac-20365 TaxID=2703897 RepID=UPI00197B976B|nr:hypothetical protein [Burkholderia sp. Ac-20365]MBN3759891.1 hypothetical protein [Burkholderia sp. Ac-20365]
MSVMLISEVGSKGFSIRDFEEKGIGDCISIVRVVAENFLCHPASDADEYLLLLG